MLESKPNILALIPARAGSKGIPGKNLREFAGRPLLAHSIECAQRVPAISRVVLTTDSKDMAEAGRSFGAEIPFMRPPELAIDTTPMLEVIQHTARFLSKTGWVPDVIILLQPTAPFRHDTDISAALSMILDKPNAESIVSVEEVPSHFSPHYVMKIADGFLTPFLPEGERVTRRQDAPPAYTRNGQFYIMRHSTLMEKNSIYGDHSIPFVTSHEAVNLDTLEDWEAAEQLVKKSGLRSG